MVDLKDLIQSYILGAKLVGPSLQQVEICCQKEYMLPHGESLIFLVMFVHLCRLAHSLHHYFVMHPALNIPDVLYYLTYAVVGIVLNPLNQSRQPAIVYLEGGIAHGCIHG